MKKRVSNVYIIIQEINIKTKKYEVAFIGCKLIFFFVCDSPLFKDILLECNT